MFVALLVTAAATANSQVNLGTTTSTTPASSVVDPYTVTGRVINGMTGAGVPRVQVSLMNRHVLTDAQGNFQFPGYTLTRGSVNTSKPGYSNTPDGSPAMRLLGAQDLSSPLELKLYPNPILTGVVSGRDGLPISGAQVRLFLANPDINGVRWAGAGAATTDSRGEYRFNPAPGNYRVSVGYNPRTFETEEMVLPVSVPELSSTDKSSYLTLAPGQERRVNLQPRTGSPYPVNVQIDPPSARNLRFTVTDSAGDSFQTGAEGNGEAGDYRIFLPAGTFTIRAHVDQQDISEEGSARVTVTSKGAMVALQLAPLTNVLVETAVDPASATISTATSNAPQNQSPNPRQFNLTLKNEKNIGDGINNDVTLAGGNGETPFSFRVPPGRYRLQGNGGGAWHVESATYGQTNLLTSDLVVAQGSGAATIRVLVDNRTGTLQGTVHLPSTPVSAWVYLIPQTPTLSAITPIYVSSSGNFSARPPIGTYNVVAVDHLLRVDLRDPDTARNFATTMKTVEITSGGQATLDLNLAEETKKGGGQ